MWSRNAQTEITTKSRNNEQAHLRVLLQSLGTFTIHHIAQHPSDYNCKTPRMAHAFKLQTTFDRNLSAMPSAKINGALDVDRDIDAPHEKTFTSIIPSQH